MDEFEADIVTGIRSWGKFFYPHNAGRCSHCLFKRKIKFNLKPFSFEEWLIAKNPCASETDVRDLALSTYDSGRTEEPGWAV